MAGTQTEKSLIQPASQQSRYEKIQYAIYLAALAVAIGCWFVAIRAPLWLDETGSYWEIKDGFAPIWARQTLSFPAHAYLLWGWTRVFGTSEVAMRSLSIVATLGAVYLLYLAARELFQRDAAFLAAIIFCIHPVVIFESIDVRPYAFAALAINAAILTVFRLRDSSSNWMAALFGLLSASILYFQYLFAVILPALLVCFFVLKKGDRKTLWRQFGTAIAVYVLACVPLIPGVRFMFHTSGAHICETPPVFSDLIRTLAAGWLPFVFLGFCVVWVIAAVIAKRRSSGRSDYGFIWRFNVAELVACASLALIPILILYGVSVGTSIHTFVARHRLVAVPGIALCWASVLSRFRPAASRLAFCVALMVVTPIHVLTLPGATEHEYSWKYALDYAEKNASRDGAPVLICSDFIESNYAVMPPPDSAKSSRYFAPLSYYKLSVPVVPLPLALNDQAMQIGSRFLEEAMQKHQRFLALAYRPSEKTLNWLAEQASGAFEVRNHGEFDKVEVMEFIPRVQNQPATPGM